jgi:hypothetical protein
VDRLYIPTVSTLEGRLLDITIIYTQLCITTRHFVTSLKCNNTIPILSGICWLNRGPGLDSRTVLTGRFKRNMILNSRITIKLFVVLSVFDITLLVYSQASPIQVVSVVTEAVSKGSYLMLF